MRDGQVRRALQPVEVEPGVDLRRSGQPFCTEADFVFLAGYDLLPAGMCGLDMVVPVLVVARGHQVQGLVPGRVRIVNDCGAPVTAMRTEHAPCGGRCPDSIRLEITVLHELDCSAVRIFDHAEVVQQHFPRRQQT